MADLGDLLGSLMSGLIRARKMADEQTAALAEYYKHNPLLEGLSVPRIRIPELTIDMPFLIEDHAIGQPGEMKAPSVIASAASAQLKESLARHGVQLPPKFQQAFAREVTTQLTKLKLSNQSVMEEAIARQLHVAFDNSLGKTRAEIGEEEKELIAKDLREKVSPGGIAKAAIPSGILANIKTADVKENASDANVVRLKITLKEEGLEWGIKSNGSGGVARTLQAE